MRSLSTLPKTIAASLPLPIGNASFHSDAGWRYQRRRSDHDAGVESWLGVRHFAAALRLPGSKPRADKKRKVRRFMDYKTRSWERGRPVRTACEARSALTPFPPDKLFALRAQCGRDVRAPSS